MIDPARARGALLGLAAGDAYGRPLEFLRLPAVRTFAVDTSRGAFAWTDDTHMALYLGDALLDLPPASLAPGKLDEDALGHAIGRRFVAWSRDPLTPSTAPGNTCLTGAARYAGGAHWRASGVRESDGCGAVMRIAPLGIALDGDVLARAAEISALVTHAHPNAVAAASAAAVLLRQVLEEGRLSVRAVEETRLATSARWPQATDVADALAAAVHAATLPDAADPTAWLDEAAIPAGDGGWRSPSALGLALAAALRWGGGDPTAFALAVEKAARIAGDSDSVACLTGMYLGAAHGEDAIPAAWRAALPEADRLARLAGLLRAVDDARKVPPGVRTSVSHPLYVNDVLPGQLGITFLPGKKARSAFGPPWDRDLGLDLDAIAATGATLLVSLVEDVELVALGCTRLVPEAERRGIRVRRAPIVDGSVPTVDAARAVVDDAVAEMGRGGNVVVHCRGGLGRAGTVAACVLTALGRDAGAAIAEVRAARPGAVENAWQEAFVTTFAEALRAP